MRSYSYTSLVSAVVLVCAVYFVCPEKYYFNFFKPYDPIVKELGSQLSPGASIVLPKDNTRFAELTKRFCDFTHPDITAVVRVGTENDVPQIINYAKRNGRAIFAGSARHGWAPTINKMHNAIMIDVSTLSTLDIDLDTDTMTIGGGVTVSQVMTTVHAAKKETPTGICPCVGFLGATLGGGHGRLQGLHGLMSDNLISVHLATAAGELITVSDTSHSDLFWGLRGAGHNFGIVTKAVYKIYNETNGGQQFNADIIYDSEHIEAIFTALNKFEQQPETTVLVLFGVAPSLKPVVALSFVSSSPTAVALSQLNSVFGHIPHLSRTESVIPWDKIEELGGMAIGRIGCATKGRINLYAASLKHYDIPTVRNLYSEFVKFTTAHPTANGSFIVFETYPVQGVQAIDDAATAYPLRQERFNVLLSAGLQDPAVDDVSERFLNKSTTALHATGGFDKPVVYLNYAQGPEGFGALYGYDDWRRKRLMGLKKKWDSEGMFNGYHPIPLE